MPETDTISATAIGAGAVNMKLIVIGARGTGATTVARSPG
jgi:hypothetical protein